MTKDLELLRTRIKRVYRCEAIHRESAPVHEMIDGQTLWKGEVEIFELFGHREAKACYAWLLDPESEAPRIMTVLGKPPVDSPAMAVRTAIFFDMQPVRYHHAEEYSEEMAR